jgi:predicted AlkP superfamily phosphohydrolase/phosphomutase
MSRRALLSASVAGALLAAHVALLTLFLNPAARLDRDALAITLALFLPYAGAATTILGALALAAGAVARGRTGRRPPIEGLPWFSTLTFVVTAAAAILYWTNLLSYRHSIPQECIRGLAGSTLALGCCALVLVAVGIDTLLFPFRGRGVSAALVVLSAAASVIVPLALRPAPVADVADVRLHADDMTPARRVILIGADGLGPDFVREGVARGALPSFDYLLRRGAHGPLATLRPTEGPPVWTSIVTGALPRAHGVKSFVTYRLAGSDTVFELLPKGLLVSVLERAGLVRTAPVTSAARRRPALWNALNAFAVDAGVVRLWATHPVERVRGFMLSPRLHQGVALARPAHLLHPRDLMAEVAGQVVSAADVDRALVSEFVDASVPAGPDDERLRRILVEEALAPDFTYERAAAVLRSAYDPPFFVTYYYGLDVVGHAFLRFAQPGLFGNVDPDSARRYGRVVERYATLIGERVADMAERRRPSDIVVLVSGYGMDPATLADRLVALATGRGPIGGTHERAPDGYFIAVGEGLRAGATLHDASVVDVAPTLLYLMGLPVARDMDGRVLTEILEEDYARSHPLTFIPSYGRAGIDEPAARPAADRPADPEPSH